MFDGLALVYGFVHSSRIVLYCFNLFSTSHCWDCEAKHRLCYWRGTALSLRFLLKILGVLTRDRWLPVE